MTDTLTAQPAVTGTNGAGDVKKTRTRKPVEGVRISFVISQDRYNKLDAAAKSDLRTADNLAMVATTKYVDNLDGPKASASASHSGSR